MNIRAFAALRPEPRRVAAVAAVPYDVVDTTEARELAKGNSDSFLHVSRPEIDMPDGTDPSSDAAYDHAAAALKALQNRGVMIRESKPALYVYRQVMGAHSQTGVVACLNTEDYRNNVLRRHEKTRADKEDDRTRHILRLGAHTGPVFLTYRDQPEIDRLVSATCAAAPLYDFTAPDGIKHTVWRVAGDTKPWCAAFAKVPVAYIADGHHRAAAAARAAKERGGDYCWFLGVVFPASQLHILPYNRLLKDLNGLSKDAFLAAVKKVFTVTGAKDGAASAPRSCRMYLDGKWFNLAWTVPAGTGPVEALDVSVLQDRLLAPVLGIDDPRTSKRISFMGGIRGLDALKAKVDSGTDAIAFSMFPVTVDQMMAIADAGAIMPPKSTWFEPKLRSGLFVHPIGR